jgi:hypothetical protein
MFHGLLLHRRLVALAATVALVLASPWAANAAADVAQVTVVSPGGGEQTLSLEALAGLEDVRERAYPLRSAAAEGSQTVTGFSLAAILDHAGADPYGFSYLEVQRPAGGAVQLSRDQALDPGAFAAGPPVVYATTSGTGFVRPQGSAEDLNGDDSFEAPQGVRIVLRNGAPLQVRATASSRRVEAGQPVNFSATVERAGAGEQLAYSWYFDDGGSASGAEASHTFAKRGSYDVVLGVTSGEDDAGASAVVTIQVGAPSAGPNRKGGGTSNDPVAPDHGIAEGPTPTSVVPPVGSVDGGSGRAPTDTQRGRRPRVRRGMTAPAPATTERETPAGDLIEGELVSAETSLPPKLEKAAARTGELDGGSGSGIPDAAWGLLATLGLLGLGAAAEAGGVAGIRFWRRAIS